MRSQAWKRFNRWVFLSIKRDFCFSLLATVWWKSMFLIAKGWLKEPNLILGSQYPSVKIGYWCHFWMRHSLVPNMHTHFLWLVCFFFFLLRYLLLTLVSFPLQFPSRSFSKWLFKRKRRKEVREIRFDSCAEDVCTLREQKLYDENTTVKKK